MLPEVGSTIVPPGPSLPVALGGLDHAQADPVLVRAARVQVLELGEQRAAELRAELLEPDDRRPADEVEEGRVLARHRGERIRPRPSSSGWDATINATVEAASVTWRPLGELFVGRGLITEAELETALAEQAATGQRLGEILVERGLVSGPDLTSALMDQLGVEISKEEGYGSGLWAEIKRRHQARPPRRRRRVKGRGDVEAEAQARDRARASDRGAHA